MTVTAIRLQEFMAFRDTGWIDLRPITLLFGRNSSGKSAILRALLLLRQSLDAPAAGGPLAFSRQEGYDFGDFVTLVRDHDTTRRISVWFRCRFASHQPSDQWILGWRTNPALPPSQARLPVEEFALRLLFGPNGATGSKIVGVDVYWEGHGLLTQANAPPPVPPDAHPDASSIGWRIASTVMDLLAEASLQPLPEDEPPLEEQAAPEADPADRITPADAAWNIWQHTVLDCPQDFLPAVPSLEGVARAREPNGYRALREILDFLAEDIRGFLKGIHHLGPLRPPPKRHFYLADQQTGRLSYEGFLHHYLAAHDAGQGGLSAINDWLAASDLHVQMRLDVVSKADHLYKLMLTNLPKTPVFEVNWCEAGFGNTQILPIVVELLLAPPGSLILLEQPELHLHPRAQAALGDLLILAAQRGMQVVIETHSEHLLLRLRRRLAETVAQAFAPALQGDPRYSIEEEAVRVYFVETVERRHVSHLWEDTRRRRNFYAPRRKGRRRVGRIWKEPHRHRHVYLTKQPERRRLSRVHTIQLGKVGDLRDLPQGFQDFFSDDLWELLALDEAILRIPREQRHG